MWLVDMTPHLKNDVPVGCSAIHFMTPRRGQGELGSQNGMHKNGWFLFGSYMRQLHVSMGSSCKLPAPGCCAKHVTLVYWGLEPEVCVL